MERIVRKLDLSVVKPITDYATSNIELSLESNSTLYLLTALHKELTHEGFAV